MKNTIIFVTCFFAQVLLTHALVINEIMSNPIGDDSGREWIEVYNDADSGIDIASLTISIKGGTFVLVTPVSGGTVISPRGYAIIASTVSGGTKFSQDYPSYSGPLVRSSISLVNSGVTSVELNLQGNTVDSLLSYTAAKEGSTYSRINGVFSVVLPTPGNENQLLVEEGVAATSSGTTGSQVTIPQSVAPTSDIVFYLAKDKTVVAGAPSIFSTYVLTGAGKPIDSMMYSWSFGDGGEKTGSSTLYTYFYPGRYVAEVEGTNGVVAGKGRINVRVLAPDISISPIGYGKYGSYIDITNPNSYELDISLWKLSIDEAGFPFPKNTVLQPGVTRFNGVVMHFSSTTIASSTLIKVLFPNMEEVVRVYQNQSIQGVNVSKISSAIVAKPSLLPKIAGTTSVRILHTVPQQPPLIKSGDVSNSKVTLAKSATTTKDIRIATFIKSLFR